MAGAAMCKVAALLVALCFLPGGSALVMGSASVPPLKFRGDDANLNCGYQDDDETGSGAINVTWFKDGVQFYHSVNQGLDVSITVSDVPGVQVDKEESAFRYMTLKSVKVNSAGNYRCVASSAKNSVASEDQYMLVIAPPTSDPVITGFREAVWHANGTLTVNCTAGESFPGANITWSVGGKPADQRQLIPFPKEVDEEGLETSRLGLVLQLGPDPSKQEFHVTCEATVNKTVFSTGTNSASRDDLFYMKTTDMKIGPSSGAARAGSTAALLLLLLLPVLATHQL